MSLASDDCDIVIFSLLCDFRGLCYCPTAMEVVGASEHRRAAVMRYLRDCRPPYCKAALVEDSKIRGGRQWPFSQTLVTNIWTTGRGVGASMSE